MSAHGYSARNPDDRPGGTGGGEPQSRLSTQSDKYSFLTSAFWDGYLCVSTLRVAIQFFRHFACCFADLNVSDVLAPFPHRPSCTEIIPRARVTIRRLADPTTPYGRPDVWPGPPRGREITGKLRFTPLNVLLTQGLRPPHMHTAIRKTARSLTCLLRNFCPFIPL